MCLCVYVFAGDKSKTIEPRAVKFGARDDLEEPWSGVDFRSKRLKVKVAWLENVRARLDPLPPQTVGRWRGDHALLTVILNALSHCVDEQSCTVIQMTPVSAKSSSHPHSSDVNPHLVNTLRWWNYLFENVESGARLFVVVGMGFKRSCRRILLLTILECSKMRLHFRGNPACFPYPRKSRNICFHPAGTP